MKKKNWPFISHNQKELKDLENHCYNLQVGSDFMSVQGHYAFTEKEVQALHEQMLDEVLDILEDSENKEDEQYALSLLGSLRITKVRIH